MQHKLLTGCMVRDKMYCSKTVSLTNALLAAAAAVSVIPATAESACSVLIALASMSVSLQTWMKSKGYAAARATMSAGPGLLLGLCPRVYLTSAQEGVC